FRMYPGIHPKSLLNFPPCIQVCYERTNATRTCYFVTAPWQCRCPADHPAGEIPPQVKHHPGAPHLLSVSYTCFPHL
ncbi:MAG: hypothetical protein LUH00_10530, partial [Lachnospiraceae bacterium]|nr:hypothetical protein [Lachnospiraceae bacterium]